VTTTRTRPPQRSAGVPPALAEETVWLTQKLIGVLFDKGRSTITEHLKNIFETGELAEKAVCRDFRHTAEDGKDYTTQFYNLDAIIAVGFRVNSARAIQFRQWATGVLRDYAIRGYVLDKQRLKNGAFLSKEYYENLLAEIREIRASERRFYQKITDIYATAMDYNPDAEVTRTFFATVQNKLHFAIHGQTAAEVIVARADSKKERMGLTTWRNAPQNPQTGCGGGEELPHGKGIEVAGPDCDDVPGLCRGSGRAEYSHDDDGLGWQTECFPQIQRAGDSGSSRQGESGSGQSLCRK